MGDLVPTAERWVHHLQPVDSKRLKSPTHSIDRTWCRSFSPSFSKSLATTRYLRRSRESVVKPLGSVASVTFALFSGSAMVRRESAHAGQSHDSSPSKHDATQVISCHPASRRSVRAGPIAEHLSHPTGIDTFSWSRVETAHRPIAGLFPIGRLTGRSRARRPRLRSTTKPSPSGEGI